MELLDVYDYNGNKKGYSVKRGYHAQNDWFLCIHAYIVTPDGKFLIQQRAMTKKYFPGIWDITCGAALSGETSLCAAIRETKEELLTLVKNSEFKDHEYYSTIYNFIDKSL